MSINYNKKDYHLPEIFQATGLDGKKTRNEYRLYGLSNEGNPAVLLEYRGGFDPKVLQPVMDFLNSNKISCKISAAQDGKRHVYIGLRYDIRDKQPDLAVKIVKTIIYHCEGLLEKANFSKKIKIRSFKDFSPKHVKKQDAPEEKMNIKTVAPTFEFPTADDDFYGDS